MKNCNAEINFSPKLDGLEKNLSTKPYSQSKKISLARESRIEEDSRPGKISKQLLEFLKTKTISKDEWSRCAGLTLPRTTVYPVEMVGRLHRIVVPLCLTLLELFINRNRSEQFKNQTYEVQEKTNSKKLADRDICVNLETGGAKICDDSNPFRKKSLPTISLTDYMVRICNYAASIEPIMLLSVLSYALRLDPPPGLSDDFFGNTNGDVSNKTDTRTKLSKIQEISPSSYPTLVIDKTTVHRFVIASVCLANKAMGDHYYSNLFYAKVGGISILELNALELKLAMFLDWRLQCTNVAYVWSLLSSRM